MIDSTGQPDVFLRTLVQAREASGREEWATAASLWEAVVTTNPTQADSWLALGDAQFQAENYPSAIAAYYEALDLGAGFPFDTAYQIARCHAHDEQFDEAFAWLERAFELGFRDLRRAQTDETFAMLRDDQRFRDLVGLVKPDDLSRDEGWRHDLAFFSREIKRKAFHPWRLVSEREFDAAVGQLHADIPELGDYEILIEIRRILTLLGDGHANAFFADDHPLAPATLPLQFYLFEEGLFIIASTPEHAHLLGGRVLQFDDCGIAELIDVLTPTIPRDSDSWIKHRVPYIIRELAIIHALGLTPSPEQVDLKIQFADGREEVITVSADKNLSNDELYYSFPHPAGWAFLPKTLDAPLPSFIRNQAAYYWFEYLPRDQTVYFQFNRVRDSASESFSAFTERLFRFIEDQPVLKLVIDLRCNNGGNTFLEMPFLHRLIGSRINRRGSLFVITGRRTFSAAQNFSSLIERHTEAIFAGEPTGASPNFFGETIPVELPYSKMVMNISDLYWQSAWPTDNRTWIAPLLYNPPTFAAYASNRDPALEAILALNEHIPGM